MKFLKIAGKDIGDIFKNRFIRVSVIAIIIVPLLYSLLYLDAFWDPYSKLQDMPVAVVNLDKGTTLDNKVVNYGEDLVKNLKDNPAVGWKFTNEEDAKKGVEGEKYYAMFVIPSDFSTKVIAAKDGAPEIAQLIFSGNEKKNFLAAQINSRVEVELKAEIIKSISNNYVTVAFDSLYKSKDGIFSAADGSKKLYDGLSTLNDKVPSLESGVNSLEDGSNQLVIGQVSLADGMSKVNDGLSTLNNKVPQLEKGSNELYIAFSNTIYPSLNSIKNGTTDLNQKLIEGKDSIILLSNSVDPIKGGSTQISQGSTAIKDGYNNVKTGVDGLISGVNNTSSVLSTIGEDLAKAYATDPTNQNVLAAIQKLKALQGSSENLSTQLKDLSNGTLFLQDSINKFDAGVQKYTSNVNSFADGTSSLTSSVENVAAGVDKISKGLEALDAGLSEKNQGSFGQGLKAVANGTTVTNKGVQTLYTATSAIMDGANKLVNGQEKLNIGISELSSNVPDLKNGVNKLYDGSNELSTKLSSGAKELSDGLVNSSEVMGDYVSDPIELKTEAINAVPNYGTGFAPYFIPLSLWIGAIMMFFVISSKVDEDAEATKFDKVVGKYISFAFVGILQAILVSLVVLMLGLKPTSVTMFFLTNIFLSLVFISIIQCLIFLFGDAGRLFSIVLLILQLTACGGTFPLEVVPGFFKVINPFMPFTYAVEALREVISATTINYGTVGNDMLILSIVFVVFLTISITFINIGERLTNAIEGRKAA